MVFQEINEGGGKFHFVNSIAISGPGSRGKFFLSRDALVSKSFRLNFRIRINRPYERGARTAVKLRKQMRRDVLLASLESSPPNHLYISEGRSGGHPCENLIWLVRRRSFVRITLASTNLRVGKHLPCSHFYEG